MSVTKISSSTTGQIWSGLSTDTKPITPAFPVGISALFYETDTGDKFEYRGNVIGWVAI